MKVKIGTRIGEITPEYFSKFGKNFNKFARALGIMFPQSTEEIAKDIWHQMGGVEIIEKPILEPSVEVSEQEVIHQFTEIYNEAMKRSPELLSRIIPQIYNQTMYTTLKKFMISQMLSTRYMSRPIVRNRLLNLWLIIHLLKWLLFL